MRVLRVIGQIVHLLVGVAATFAIGGLAAWAYPMGKHSIGLVTQVAAIVVIVISIRPILRAAQGKSGNE